MKIYLKQRYRGALTNEQWLAYGEHDASELPDGLAQYLVDNGHATVIEAESKPIARSRADKTITPDEVANVEPDMEYHNELMKQSGRPRALTQAERNELFDEYEELSGSKPPHNIGDATLQARVEELRDEG